MIDIYIDICVPGQEGKLPSSHGGSTEGVDPSVQVQVGGLPKQKRFCNRETLSFIKNLPLAESPYTLS